MTVYPLLASFLKELAPSWRKTQLDNLTHLAYALYERRSLCLAELARSYPPPRKPRVRHPKHGLFHRLKRLRRFLTNPRVNFVPVFRYLVKLGNIACQSPGLLLPILLDPTYFGNYTTVVASVPRSGRALPVVVRTFRRNLEGEKDLSENEIVEKIGQGTREELPESIDVVLVADREFASARFFQFLRSIKVGFAIRVDAETWIEHEDYQGPLGRLPLEPGSRRLWLGRALYGKEAKETVNLLGVWERGQKEPWFIATGLDHAQITHRLYRKRMQIEHGFRDWEHHMKLKGTLKVETPGRAQVLIRTLALLYWFLCWVGLRLNRPEYQARVTYWGKPSIFFLALHLFLAGVEAAIRAGQKVVRWVKDKPWPYRPLPPAYKLRYRRFRSDWLQ